MGGNDLTLYACVAADMFYWMIVGVILARRPVLPTPGDLSLIAHGFLLLAFPVTFIMWTGAYSPWWWEFWD